MGVVEVVETPGQSLGAVGTLRKSGGVEPQIFFVELFLQLLEGRGVMASGSHFLQEFLVWRGIRRRRFARVWEG